MSEEIRAQILNLSASILMGKATNEQIEKVTKLAIDNGESNFLHQEMKDCERILQANC